MTRIENKPLNATPASATVKELPRLFKIAQKYIKSSSHLTSGGASTQDCIADISYFLRSWSRISTPAIQFTGFSTAANSVTGTIAGYKAAQRFQESYKIGDKEGMAESMIDVARGFNQALAGADYAIVRISNIFCEILNLNSTSSATSAMGKTAYWSGMLGNVFFTLFYGLIGVWGSFNAIKASRVRLKMADAKDSAQLFNLLARKVTADPKISKHKVEKIDATKLGLSELTDQFMILQRMLKLDKKDQISRSTAEACLSSLTELKGRKILAKVGKDVFHLNRQKVKEAKFERATSGGCVESIKKAIANGLGERLKSEKNVVKQAAENELKEIVSQIKSANNINLVISSGLILSSVFGVAVSLMGFFAFSTIGLGIAAAINIAVAGIFFICVDSISLWLGLKDSQPGKYDKHFVIGAALLLAATFVGGLATTVIFGFPLLQLLIASVVTALGLGLCAYSLHRLYQKERNWKADHPSLKEFHKLLNLELGAYEDKEVSSIFKKLSAGDKAKIRANYEELFSKEGSNLIWDLVAKLPTKKRMKRDLILRALKKTAKSFWASNHRRKIQVQELMDLFKNKEVSRVKLSKKLDALVSSKTFRNRLNFDLWYVSKLNNDFFRLKEVTHAVIAEAKKAKKKFKLESANLARQIRSA